MKFKFSSDPFDQQLFFLSTNKWPVLVCGFCLLLSSLAYFLASCFEGTAIWYKLLAYGSWNFQGCFWLMQKCTDCQLAMQGEEGSNRKSGKHQDIETHYQVQPPCSFLPRLEKRYACCFKACPNVLKPVKELCQTLSVSDIRLLSMCVYACMPCWAQEIHCFSKK